jgi:hypothetical protein
MAEQAKSCNGLVKRETFPSHCLRERQILTESLETELAGVQLGQGQTKTPPRSLCGGAFATT